MHALKENPSGEVKLNLTSVVANMSTSKSIVRDKKTQPSSVRNVEVDSFVVKDNSVVSVSSWILETCIVRSIYYCTL